MAKIEHFKGTLIPAYGRDYKSIADVIQDLELGKDFRVEPFGQYCSIRDFAPGTQLAIRYARLRKVMFYTVE